MNGCSPETLACLRAYDWPGNVRELENVMERAVVLAPGPTITVQDLSLEEPESPGVPDTRDALVLPANATLAEVEREAIIQALQRNQGNRQAAARQLAIGPATLYRKVKSYKESEDVEVLAHYPEAL